MTIKQVILNGIWFLRGSRRMQKVISKFMQYIKAETETHIAGPMKAITLAVNQRVVLNLQVQKLTAKYIFRNLCTGMKTLNTVERNSTNYEYYIHSLGIIWPLPLEVHRDFRVHFSQSIGSQSSNLLFMTIRQVEAWYQSWTDVFWKFFLVLWFYILILLKHYFWEKYK